MAAVPTAPPKQLLIFKQSKPARGADAAFRSVAAKPVNDTWISPCGSLAINKHRVARLGSRFPEPQPIPAELNTACTWAMPGTGEV